MSKSTPGFLKQKLSKRLSFKLSSFPHKLYLSVVLNFSNTQSTEVFALCTLFRLLIPKVDLPSDTCALHPAL